MNDSIGLPRNVALVSEAMHSAHEEISKVIIFQRQLACSHPDYTYTHEEWDEGCKYCQIDACMLKECRTCKKEYR